MEIAAAGLKSVAAAERPALPRPGSTEAGNIVLGTGDIERMELAGEPAGEKYVLGGAAAAAATAAVAGAAAAIGSAASVESSACTSPAATGLASGGLVTHSVTQLSSLASPASDALPTSGGTSAHVSASRAR